jgi:hypothetical protein
MATRKKTKSHLLIEKAVRNDDIFCSLLFDELNSTLRVVDFRGGNLTQKQAYLERIQIAEKLRKVYTLIERDDMHAWQRAGYIKEGSIPGYYKRSDAYLMGRIVDNKWDSNVVIDEADKRKEYINDLKELGQSFEKLKTTGLKTENITEEETPKILKQEYDRRNSRSAKSKKVDPPDFNIFPVFMQFSREVEYYHYSCENKKK